MAGRVLFAGRLHPMAAVAALMTPLPAARTYKRDREGKFSSGGGGGSIDDLQRGPIPTVEDAAKGTNPRYGQTGSMDAPVYRDAAKAGQRWTPEMGPPPSGAFEENCTNTVMAFEMRMRGYNVEAAPLDVLDKHGYAGGRTYREIEDQLASNWRSADGTPHGRSLNNQEWRSFDKIDGEIARDWPEGGRGAIYVGKHVFSVVKRGGKAQYVEPQFDATPSRNVTKDYKKKYGPGKGIKEGDFGSGVAKVIRLDDLVPTDGIFESIAVRE